MAKYPNPARRDATPTAQPAIPPPVARARGGTVRRELPPKPATTIPDKPVATRIKVRATQMGYYDHIRRHPGDVFYIDREQVFSTKWMERVGEHVRERVTSAPDALRRQHDEILQSRMPAMGTPLVDDEPDAGNNPLGA
jgi:hypothetical protein